MMCRLLACLSLVAMLGGAALCAGQANRLVEEVRPASVRGHATVYETINRFVTGPTNRVHAKSQSAQSSQRKASTSPSRFFAPGRGRD
jgi:hypothetical protein